MAGRLEDQVALVTGAGRGMGLEVALAMAGEGARVVVAEIDPDRARDSADQIEAAGGTARAVVGDVSRVEDVGRLFEAAVEAFGTVDLLVNNAGIGIGKPLLDYTEADWDRQMGVNLKGVFFCSQAAARLMLRRQRGRIVNFASVSAFVSSSNPSIAYDISKGAVRQLTVAMAAELAPHGINVNAVAPGTVETDMSRQSLSTEEGRAWQLMRIPMGRVAQPGDIAPAVLFLCSREADYVTGHTLVVDGGWLLY